MVTTFSDGESTLRIMNAVKRDKGEYQCVLSESSSIYHSMQGGGQGGSNIGLKTD